MSNPKRLRLHSIQECYNIHNTSQVKNQNSFAYGRLIQQYSGTYLFVSVAELTKHRQTNLPMLINLLHVCTRSRYTDQVTN